MSFRLNANQESLHYLAVDIRKPHLAAAERIGQACVIETQQV
jgi:hypothetical protein